VEFAIRNGAGAPPSKYREPLAQRNDVRIDGALWRSDRAALVNSTRAPDPASAWVTCGIARRHSLRRQQHRWA
jgi:hypothetical protein